MPVGGGGMWLAIAQPCGSPVRPRVPSRRYDVVLRWSMMLRRPLAGLAVAALEGVRADGECAVLLAAGCPRSGTCGSAFPLRATSSGSCSCEDAG